VTAQHAFRARRLLSAALILLFSAANLLAQSSQTNATNASPENDRRQVVPFLDPTYVALARATRFDQDLKRSITDWTFEADIVPNFVVHQTFFDAIGQQETVRLAAARVMGARQPGVPGGPSAEAKVHSRYTRAWSIAAVPMVKLRMFVNEPSAPVRTPSYMPKGTGQMFFFAQNSTHADLFALQATVGHHSNGQDGCLYKTEDPAHDCLPLPPLDRSHVEVNRKDGSFSTNYLLFGGRYRRIGLETSAMPAALKAGRDLLADARAARNAGEIGNAVTVVAEAAAGLSGHAEAITAAADDVRAKLTGGGDDLDRAIDTFLDVTNLVVRESRHDLTIGLDVEVNPGHGAFLGGGGIDPELKSRYGPTRLTFLAGAAAQWDHVCNRAEVKGFARYIHNPPQFVPSLAGSVEGQCLFRDTNWGVFVRFYGGQDYYNLGFEDDVRRVQFGMTYSQEGFLRFVSKAVKVEHLNSQLKMLGAIK